MLRLLRRPFCRHDWRLISTVNSQDLYRCGRCGARRLQEDFYDPPRPYFRADTLAVVLLGLAALTAWTASRTGYDYRLGFVILTALCIIAAGGCAMATIIRIVGE